MHKYLQFSFYILCVYMSVSVYGQTQVWQNLYNGLKLNADRANDILAEPGGNTYIGGYSVVENEGRNAEILKYDNAGTLLWVQSYNVLSTRYDEINALAFDNSGNIYAAGVGYSNFLILKLNASDGSILWSKTYDGSGADYDAIDAITVDASGNLYVTGRSDRDQTSAVNYDYLTQKYTSSGTLSWTAVFNGTGNADDLAQDIAVDASGNVYVTGESLNASLNQDIVTLKYNSAGVLQWNKTISGAAGEYDAGNALEIAGSFLYLTGQIVNTPADYDYITIKYDFAGNTVWSMTYNSGNDDKAVDVKVDGSGNVMVTGRSESNGPDYDVTTVKYNSTGTQQWVNNYDSPYLLNDRPSEMVLDGNSNIHITGRSEKTTLIDDIFVLKVNANGITAWSAVYNDTANGDDSGDGIALDGAGNVFVTGLGNGTTTQTDIITLKYNSAGTQQWLQRYNAIGDNYDRPRSIVNDNSGNSYVTGYSMQGSSERDIITIKYSPTGAVLWQQVYNSIPGDNKIDEGTIVMLDGSGNVYVGGMANNNYAILKYSSGGSLLWAQSFDGTGAGFDEVTDMVVDNSGNVVVTGRSDVDISGTVNYNITTIKYNSGGGLVWSQTFNGAGNDDDRAESIATDASGNIYVTGRTTDASGSFNLVFLKYTAAGSLAYTKLHGAANYYDQGMKIKVDGSNVYIAGNLSYTNGTTGLLLKYNIDGTLLWQADYAVSGNDYFMDILIDASSNVFVTGTTMINGSEDGVLAKYSSSGTFLWDSNHISSPNANNRFSDMVLDCAGNVYISGYANGNGSDDAWMAKYDGNTGTEVWENTFAGSSGLDDRWYDISILINGNTSKLYVTGVNEDTNTQGDIITRLYQDINTIAIIPSTPNICPGSILQVSGAGTGSFSWSEGGSVVSTSATYTIPALSGSHTYNLSWTGNGCNGTASRTYNIININPAISGSQNGCTGSNFEYSVPAVAGATYTWTITNGTIISGQGTSTIIVSWNAGSTGTLSVIETIP